MGKGLNKRRRAKQVEAAKDGNLHKAQWGKASGSLKPPKAPSKQDFVEHIPASLRKLMAAKALAQEQDAKKQKGMKQKGGQLLQVPLASESKGQQAQQHGKHAGSSKPQAKAAPAQGTTDNGPSTLGRTQETKPSQNPTIDPNPTKVFRINAFDKAPDSKGITKRKKAYYEKREAKKKDKKLKNKPEAHMTPAELKLHAQQALTQARFGETINAPLKVQLKRKHWTGNADQGERMAKIQRSQMSKAEQQATGKQIGQGQPDKQPAKKKKKLESQVQPSGGLLHQARMQQAALDKESAREAAVEAYRQQKKQHSGSAGTATMASLGKLAAQGAERLKQQQELEQQ